MEIWFVYAVCVGIGNSSAALPLIDNDQHSMRQTLASLHPHADPQTTDRASRLWLQLVAGWSVVREGYDALVHGPEHVWLRHWSEVRPLSRIQRGPKRIHAHDDQNYAPSAQQHTQAVNDQGPLAANWFDLAFSPSSPTSSSTPPFHPTLPGLLLARANLRTLHALRQILLQWDHALVDPAAAVAAVVVRVGVLWMDGWVGWVGWVNGR
jgi:hypothetical protein